METFFSYRKLLKAYLDCRRHKRQTVNALRFEVNLEENLFRLQQLLQSRKYLPGKSMKRAEITTSS
jgi:RNA-directed DNA polymerase